MNPIRSDDWFASRHPHHHHPRGAHPGPGGEGMHMHRRGGRRRVSRGDVRTAVLLLVADQPMHGYQLMQAISERTGGVWTPSPGAVYPTIQQLEDEGLVTVTTDAGRRLVMLTDVGRDQLERNREAWGDPFAAFDPSAPSADLRRLVHELVDAVRQVGRAGNDAQRTAAVKILTDARRALYLLLADGPDQLEG
jgi:DNA-binding PadR family transcriptional regulator